MNAKHAGNRKSTNKRPTPSLAQKTSLTSLLATLACIVSACLPQSPIQQGPSPGDPAPATAVQAGWYSIYFTDPDNPSSEKFRGGPDSFLADAIRAARLSVDVAVYQINLWSVRDALLDADRRGVTVRVVTESDYLDEEEVQELKAAGIPVLGDRREGFMHNKFVVIDRAEVWSGSMNLTINDAYRNNNNLLRIHSQRLAEDYTKEFEEMFVEDLFGPAILLQTPYPSLTVDGTRLEVYFSPDDGTAARLVDLIQGARESIFFLAFSFTSDDLADALIERARAGVEVAGVMDDGQYESNQGGEFDNFRLAGLNILLDSNLRRLHHKVIIIDRKIVVTGSYNFSNNAEKVNDENTLVIYNTEIARQYLEEFHRLLSQAQN